MGYQIAGIFGGALASIVAIKLVAATGSAFVAAVCVAAALAIIALLAAPETSRAALRAEPTAPRADPRPTTT